MNRFKVGDKVEILSLTEEEKETYPPGWLNPMEQYIGQLATVEQSFEKGDTSSKIQVVGYGPKST